jgi:hypothetical protein
MPASQAAYASASSIELSTAFALFFVIFFYNLICKASNIEMSIAFAFFFVLHQLPSAIPLFCFLIQSSSI